MMDHKTYTHSAKKDEYAVRYGHPSMSRAERAKIFMPFDALPEFRDLLARVEAHVTEMQETGLL